MPNFVSIVGKWVPAKEYVVDPKAPRGKEVYAGQDRAALEMLKDQGELGRDILLDPDIQQLARDRGFGSVQKYFKAIGFDYGIAKEKAEENAVNTEVTHQDPPRKKAIKELGGGHAPGAETKFGSFGETNETALAESALKATKGR